LLLIQFYYALISTSAAYAKFTRCHNKTLAQKRRKPRLNTVNPTMGQKIYHVVVDTPLREMPNGPANLLFDLVGIKILMGCSAG
jgi:hypothetical protein